MNDAERLREALASFGPSSDEFFDVDEDYDRAMRLIFTAARERLAQLESSLA
jgi:hypothetical protein